MNVKTILRSKGDRIITIPRDAPVLAAARLLASEGIGALVVSDDGATVAGILSERDIARAIADYEDIRSVPVSRLMTRDVVTCTPDDDIESLMGMMTEKRIRHIPVLVNRRLTGIVTIGDVVKVRMDEVTEEASSLRAYIAMG